MFRFICPCLLTVLLATASAHAAAPQLTAPMCATPPVIDGALAPGEWDCASGPGGFSLVGGKLLAPDQPEVYVTYDKDNLYVAARLPLPKGRQPKMAVTQRDGPVWEDDAFEIFLDPSGRRGSYYQLIVNARGTQWDGLQQSESWNAEWTSKTHVGETDWILEEAIPFASLKASTPADGQSWAVNFAWDRFTPWGFIGTWAPMSSNLHDPGRFGTLVFSSKATPVALFGPYMKSSGGLEMRGKWGPSGGALQAELNLSRLHGGKTENIGAVKQMGGQTRDDLGLEVKLPQEQGFNAAGDYQLTAQVKNGDQILWSTEVTATVKGPLDVEVEKYWLAGKLVIHLNASGLTRTPQQLGAAVKLLDDAGNTAAEVAVEKFAANGKADVTFDVGELKPGNYNLQAEAYGADKQALYAATVALEKPARPAWLGSKAGISDEVLPPWTPLKVSGNQVMPWGRTYAFARLPFPSSVITRDTEVLAGPITLSGSVDGKKLAWSGTDCLVTETEPHLVRLAGSAEAAGLTCEGTVSLEYDGMIRSDFRLIPDGEVHLDALALEIPIKPEYAKYLYHWPGRWGSAYNAGALPEDGYHGPFKPVFWLGDEWRGFCWFSESDRNFFNEEDANVVDIGRQGDVVMLRVNIIGKPQTISRPLDYTFGFQATPVKPMSPDVWDYRIMHAGNYGIEERPFFKPATISYPAEGHLDLERGTFECWIKPHFDPDPDFDPNDPKRAALNRSLLDIELGNDCHVGFYWNIDDRGMRLYYKQGTSYPLLLSTHPKWQAGQWHHVAFTWGEASRVYLDGEKVAERAFEGLLPGDLPNAKITLGKRPCEMDIDELRFSSVARESFDLSEPPQADEVTLLLDHLDEDFVPDGRKRTSPARGDGGTATGGIFGVGKFGQALALHDAGRKMTYLDYLSECGVRTICFHEHWTDIQSYPATTHTEQLHKLVKGCHDKNIQLLLYHGYLMSNIAPEWDNYHEECLVYPRRGEYAREPEQKAYIVCFRSAWQDFIADGLDKQMTEFGTDGVYLDGTSEPWGCKNVRHGCGYMKPDGAIGTTYSFFATRAMMKRIYTIVKQHNPDGQVNVHQSTCMTIPTLAFATSYWDGEQFGSIERGPYALEVLPLEAFRCEFMGHNWGVPAEFLCYNRPYTYHEAMAFTLLHDVLVRQNLAEQTKLWRAMEQFGRKQATWLPYWENQQYVRTNSPDVKVSIYNRPGQGFVAVISNLGAGERTARVSFDLARLEQSGDLIAYDILHDEEIPVRGGRLTVPLKSLDYVVVWLRGG